MASAAIAPPDVRDVTLSLFGGRKTDIAPSDCPEGLTPDEQDNVFLPGDVQSRPCLSRMYAAGKLPAGTSVVYAKSYDQPNGNPLTLVLTSDGKLWAEDVNLNPGNPALIATVAPGLYAQSVSEFGREYIAFSDLLHGADIPLQFDGTNLDRVTQDGPGAPPTVANLASPVAAIANSGTGAGIAIATLTPSDPVTYTHPVYIGGTFSGDASVTVYTTMTVVTAAPHGLSGGSVVSIAGVTPSSLNNPNAAVSAIVNATTFKIAYNSTTYTTGTGGTITPQLPSLIRNQNLVTATTSAPHGFQAGWQVQVAGIANAAIGGGIAAISRDANGVVTVTTANPHGLPIAAQIAIAGVSNPDASFNGTFPVASVPSPTTFTYQQNGTAEVSTGATGNVQDIWTGTFFIQSTPSPNTFIYQQLGANDFTNASGTATILGQISPGQHNLVLMFLTRQGAIPAPSPPVAFAANGGNQLLLSNIAIGPPNVVARIVGGTGAGGDNYFIIPATPKVNGQVVGTSTVIPDNTSTSWTLDFSDNTLFAGIAIDQPGNDLFDQRVLGPVLGFFAFASRLSCWGDYSKIENLLNMGFDGGMQAPSATAGAGSGVNSGSGAAWTNPGNISDPVNYTDVNVGVNATSQDLLGEAFGLAVSGRIALISAAFQYYWTGGEPEVIQPSIKATLLKAGIPVGVSQFLSLQFGNPQGTSGTPLSFQFTFAVGGLTAADINNLAFGIDFSVAGGGFGAHVFLRRTALTVGTIPVAPLGWSTAGSSFVGGTLVVDSLFGFNYQMTAAGGAGGAFDCLISQPAYQDASGTAILLPNTNYTARIKLSAQAGITGNLVVDLFSPTIGVLATASFNVATLPQVPAFVSAAFNQATPAVIPADVLLRIYQAQVSNGGVVTLNESSMVYSANPYNDNLSRWSYVLNPEAFAQTTGNLGAADDASPIRCFGLQRQSTLLKTAEGVHSFTDNDSEPDEWKVNPITRSVGALSLRSGDPGKFGTGDGAEDWDLVATRNGVYLFAGADFWKVSQEISRGALPQSQDPRKTWDDITWSAAHTVVAKNDPSARRAYFAVPLNGALTPNAIFVLDYREMDTATQIAASPPLHITLQGKMRSSDLTRKWSLWNVSANDLEILARPNNQRQLAIAGGLTAQAVPVANLYTLDPAKLTDDDYGAIAPYYTTYFFTDHEQEQALQIGSDIHLVKRVHAFIPGVGATQITPIVDSLYNFYPSLSPRTLVSDLNAGTFLKSDLEWTIVGLRGHRIAWRISVQPMPGATDVQYRVQKFVVAMMKDPIAQFRQSGI